jgi:nitric oxide reductase activation protein
MVPIHDFINFKNMRSGNEILLNLDNYENLTDSELVSALLELGERDKNKQFNWNEHPITEKCLKDLKKR